MSNPFSQDLNKISLPETLLYHTLSAVSSAEDEKKVSEIIEFLSTKALYEEEFCFLLTKSIELYFNRIFSNEYYDNIDYVNFFVSIIAETGLAELDETLYKYIQYKFPIFVIQDHPHRHNLNYLLKVFSKIQSKNDKYELFWKNLWENGDVQLASIAFIGLALQNVLALNQQLPLLHTRYGYNSDKLLKEIWEYEELRKPLMSMINKMKKNKEECGSRLYDRIYYSILDFKDRDNFDKKYKDV